jgi:type IV secretory pathway VirD2 relaxase
MSDDETPFRPQPGKGRGASRSPSFLGEIRAAIRRAGYTGKGLPTPGKSGGRSGFGRGKVIRLGIAAPASRRRVMVAARVVRHAGWKYRAAPLPLHLSYLVREGVSQDASPAQMFDARTDQADGQAFAERCTPDRHHFRFIVSPEDADRVQDLKGFTRTLMGQAERDLGTALDWVGVDHWNTGQPHVHILVRGKTSDGRDLVISRDWIGHGMRSRAEAELTRQLGPRTEAEITRARDAEISAERMTSLDRALRARAIEPDGVVDLRPTQGAQAVEPRLIARAQTLTRLGLATPVQPGVWVLKPDLEDTLRALATRGDIIATLHRSLRGVRPLHPEQVSLGKGEEPVIGGVLATGQHNELAGTAFLVIDGTDGRVHHRVLASIDQLAGLQPGRVVRHGPGKASPEVLSELDVPAQITARGVTWLDRLAASPDALPLAGTGFGAEARQALAARLDHHLATGLLSRTDHPARLAPHHLATLQAREVAEVTERLARQQGRAALIPAAGERFAGTLRDRLSLVSGQFAVLEGLTPDGSPALALAPWKPGFERHLGRQVAFTPNETGPPLWTLGRGIAVS